MKLQSAGGGKPAIRHELFDGRTGPWYTFPMNAPIFIRFNGELINLAHCTRVCLEDETVYFYFISSEEDYTSFEYDSEAEAEAAFNEVANLMGEQGLIANLNPPPK
jgi:hypothetical protein